MTADAHDPAAHRQPVTNASGPARDAPSIVTAPWWLPLVVIGALVLGGLVLMGILSLSALLYAGLFGGMILMHTGGHGGHGGGHAVHGAGADDVRDLSGRSSGAQPGESGSKAGLDARARNNATTSESDDHDHDRPHGCH